MTIPSPSTSPFRDPERDPAIMAGLQMLRSFADAIEAAIEVTKQCADHNVKSNVEIGARVRTAVTRMLGIPNSLTALDAKKQECLAVSTDLRGYVPGTPENSVVRLVREQLSGAMNFMVPKMTELVTGRLLLLNETDERSGHGGSRRFNRVQLNALEILEELTVKTLDFSYFYQGARLMAESQPSFEPLQHVGYLFDSLVPNLITVRTLSESTLKAHAVVSPEVLLQTSYHLRQIENLLAECTDYATTVVSRLSKPERLQQATQLLDIFRSMHDYGVPLIGTLCAFDKFREDNAHARGVLEHLGSVGVTTPLAQQLVASFKGHDDSQIQVLARLTMFKVLHPTRDASRILTERAAFLRLADGEETSALYGPHREDIFPRVELL